MISPNWMRQTNFSLILIHRLLLATQLESTFVFWGPFERTLLLVIPRNNHPKRCKSYTTKNTFKYISKVFASQFTGILEIKLSPTYTTELFKPLSSWINDGECSIWWLILANLIFDSKSVKKTVQPTVVREEFLEFCDGIKVNTQQQQSFFNLPCSSQLPRTLEVMCWQYKNIFDKIFVSKKTNFTRIHLDSAKQGYRTASKR